jgi:branched-chain amino acid transport system substrate-binding protein
MSVHARIPLFGRRRALAAGAAAAAFGAPAIVGAQAQTLKLGHLTPLTGFLGPIGEYAVMGVRLAVEEVNESGGVLGRKIELLSEDSVNPQTASTKAERMIDRDKVDVLMGEISSASGLAIAQVSGRHRTPFFQTGCNSDELRGKSCNRFMFHIEAANTMYVKAVGEALLKAGSVKGKKWYSLTADYAFGHDLLRVTQKWMGERGATHAGGDLVPTDLNDFSPFLLKVRQNRPDLVMINLAGNQTTNFLKQYNEYKLPFSLAGGGFDTVMAWGAGRDAFAGVWPLVWHHAVKTPSSEKFTQNFLRRWGRPPDNQSWGDYMGVKMLVGAYNENKSFDKEKLVQLLEKGFKFDVLKNREGYFRDWDHQLMMEMYSIRPKPKDKMTDRYDLAVIDAIVPGPDQPLESIAPTREENACSFAA